MWLVSNPQVISAECMKFKHASVFRIGRFEWHTVTFHDCKHKEEEKVLFLKIKGISAFMIQVPTPIELRKRTLLRELRLEN